MLLLFIFCFQYLSLASHDKAREIREKLKEIIKSNPTVNPLVISNLFINFTDSHGCSHKDITSEQHLIQCVNLFDKTADMSDIKDLWEYFVSHIDYMEQVRSRNSLVYYLHQNPSSINLDKSKILQNFLSSHKLNKNDVSSFQKFVEFMTSINHRVENSTIKKIFSSVYLFQEYLNRKFSHTSLKNEISSNKPSNLEALKKKIANFVFDYKLSGKIVSDLQTFRSLFYSLDYQASDADSRLIHPNVNKYNIAISEKMNIYSFEQKINSINQEKKEEILTEVQKFLSAYDLIDIDISDMETFKKQIIGKNELADSSKLELIHNHIFNSLNYQYRVKTKDLLLEFLDTADADNFDKLSNLMEPFIATHNLFDEEFPDVDAFKFYIRSENGLFTRTQAVKIYNSYIGYLLILECRQTRDVLISMILDKSDMEIQFLIPPMSRFLKKYQIENVEIQTTQILGSILRKYDNHVNDQQIKIIFPYLKIYLNYIERKDIYENLVKYLQKTANVIINFRESLDKMIKIFKLTDTHLSDIHKFLKHVKSQFYMAQDSEIATLFNNVAAYYKFKKYLDSLVVYKPGDVKPDGLIVPPTNENNLFWYNLFKISGTVPNFVTKVESVNQLIFFKQWFNVVFKYLTGIKYYYFSSDLKNIEFKSDIQTEIPSNKITDNSKSVARSRI